VAELERFDDLVRLATGHEPYGYQRRLAEDGLPELLRVPTGTGKTLAAALPWLYRRRFHPDAAVRAGTPRLLALVLPMRVLVEQTQDAFRVWLANLGLEDDVGLHLLMGGDPQRDTTWRTRPERDAIVVGTQDMLLSRALNRGYGQSRYAWPIDFGLLNSGAHWVFDEVQLMGAALPTSRQLQAFRRALGIAQPCSSTWMSATVDLAWLATVDNRDVASVVELDQADAQGPLRARLEAAKTVGRLEVDDASYVRDLAGHLREVHRSGTLRLAILNTVDRAQSLWRELRRLGVNPVLLHSRFRPPDRAARLAEALRAAEPRGDGGLVVATQVLDAGVDISATALFTEAATWASVVQRAGRCNRDGRADDANLLWAPPPKPQPYASSDVAAAVAALTALEGRSVTPAAMAALDVAAEAVEHPVLRRRDLIELFDTAPDLDGNDVDVSRFIRSTPDLDVAVAWRAVPERGAPTERELPGRDERCPVPVGDLRAVLKDRSRRAWRLDHLDETWVRCGAADVRPGQVVVLDAAQGGYDALPGWDRLVKTPVEPIAPQDTDLLTDEDAVASADPLTGVGQWVRLADHLADVEAEVRRLAAGLPADGLSTEHLEAAALAGRWHDLGKAHDCFQDMLLSTASDGERAALRQGRPWAKSAAQKGGQRFRPYFRPYFRHELASALALIADGSALDNVAESDLILYLVAAHHGRVRLGIRALPDEAPPPDEPPRRFALGVWDGDEMPEAEVPKGVIGPLRLSLGVMDMGSASGGWSWSERMLWLRDRDDLGPFRLAFLEALVRVADWRVSASYDGTGS
jgi:CRISPR-associated endonuclease/helicase Cas3